MRKGIRVLIIEDDLFSRDFMAMLLTRDWRTQVVGESCDKHEIKNIINDQNQNIDVVLLDTEVPGNDDWPFEIAKTIQSKDSCPKILCTGTQVDENLLKEIIETGFAGYILKDEIHYALASAVTNVTKEEWVTTEGIWKAALKMHLALPENIILMDGEIKDLDITDRQWEIARLALIFNQTHREIADELIIRADSVAKVVSMVYKKIGLQDIISRTEDPEMYINDSHLLEFVNEILNKLPKKKRIRKSSDMSTLAFHLLTKPGIRKIYKDAEHPTYLDTNTNKW